MKAEILSYFEALWQAEEYNLHTGQLIPLPINAEELLNYAKVIEPELTLEALEGTLLYENITIKEYAVSSVQTCFSKKDSSLISKKKSDIIKELRKLSEHLDLTLSA